ncbi:MAG: DNA repair protein RecN [Gammaproteobacteria bacterium]
MLTHIHIWNFAIVEKLDMELEDGLTVLTGETGAGKSILLDALNLSLGDRADTGVIRHGAEKAEISVTFDTANAPAAESWLKEHEMDSEQECIIRRVISNKGSSKAFINGKPAPIQQLRELGEMLVDLHGQHEHQSLLKNHAQRQLLDDYAAHTDLVKQVNDAYQQWRNLQDELQRLSKAQRDRNEKLELLRYQVDELEKLALSEDELPGLENEHKKLANATQLISTCEKNLHLLEDNEHGAINSLLSQSSNDIQNLCTTDENLKEIAEMLESALIQSREAASELRDYVDRLDIDPQRLEEVEQRLGTITDLSRKHHVQPEELPALLPKLQEELNSLENAEGRLNNLEEDISKAAENYQKLASKLSQSRTKAAKTLSISVTDSMQELGMDGGCFEVQLANEENFTAHGLENINFMVSANPGQPVKPLTRVASGGELSRISLAIQVITAQNSRIPTLVFDEVDVGIGGRVAEIVGRLLRELGAHRQVICVTHLPQVAALGHHHLQVSKQKATDTTISQIAALQQPQRIEEIARMLGGIEITEQTLSHAEEMLKKAGNE